MVALVQLASVAVNDQKCVTAMTALVHDATYSFFLNVHLLEESSNWKGHDHFCISTGQGGAHNFVIFPRMRTLCV